MTPQEQTIIKKAVQELAKALESKTPTFELQRYAMIYAGGMLEALIDDPSPSPEDVVK